MGDAGRGGGGGRGKGDGSGRGGRGGGRGDAGGGRGRGSRGGGGGGRGGGRGKGKPHQPQDSAARREKERLEREKKEKEERERQAREEAERKAREIAERLTAMQECAARLRDAAKAAVTKRKLRAANDSPQRPEEDAFKALDSSVKRNTALIKRLRQVGEDGHEALCADLLKANQSKYVAEAVQAVCEAPIKLRDINATVQVCSVLHQRYADFGGNLVASLAALFAPSGKDLADDDQQPSATVKRRTTLRLLAELYFCGFYTDLGVLLGIVKGLLPTQAQELAEVQSNLTLLSSLSKACKEELLGVPRRASNPAADFSAEVDGEVVESLTKAIEEIGKAQEELDQELKEAYVLPEDQSKKFSAAMEQALSIGFKQLVKANQAMLLQDKVNAEMLSNKGELSEEAVAGYEKTHREFDALQRVVATLAESLERELPELPGLEPDPVEAEEEPEAGAADEAAQGKASDAVQEDLFDDEDTRAFYESLPDIRSLVPAVLLEDGDKDGENGDKDGSGSSDAAPENVPGGSQLDLLLLRLPTCVSRDLCDEFSLAFCYLNSKTARKKLVKMLVEVPRGASQLLPHYARITATLAPVFPDVSQGVLLGLEQKIHAMLSKRETSNAALEKRVRHMHYVGELCKFRLAPYMTIFSLFKVFLDNFSGLNIDSACALLDSAGRFLYKNSETAPRTMNMLQIMMRIKNAKNLDSRQSSLVDSAYYQCCPPERSAVPEKKRPPEHEWIRHLVYDQLNADNVDKIMKKLRRLPWAEHEDYLLKCLLKVVRGRFSSVPLVAKLTSALSKYHDTLGIALVDRVMELVHQGLERPETGQYQQRVAHMRLLGELYICRLVDLRGVFDTLHLLITYVPDEPSSPGNRSQEQEAAEHMLFRVRLICTLLNTCGQYFDRGYSKKRLDQFLVLFQHFCLWLSPLPLVAEFEVEDLFTTLRPKMARFTTVEEAAEALKALELGAEGGQASSGAGKEARDEATGENDDDHSGSEDSGGESEEDDDEELGHQNGAEAEAAGAEAEAGRDEYDDAESDAEGPGEQNEQGGNIDEGDDEVTLKMPIMKQEVDDEFEAQFMAMMQEATGTRGAPAMFPTAAVAAPTPQIRVVSKSQATSEDSPAVAFKVLTKKGGKEDRTCEVQVPVNAAMAVNARKKEEEEAQERSLMKRLVLEASKREEEELRAAERAERFQQARQIAGARSYHRGGQYGGSHD